MCVVGTEAMIHFNEWHFFLNWDTGKIRIRHLSLFKTEYIKLIKSFIKKHLVKRSQVVNKYMDYQFFFVVAILKHC